MKNPYEVLGVSQDASHAEIIAGFKVALMKDRKAKQHTQADLMGAQKQLLSATRRLAADFMYPTRPRAKRPKALVWPEDAAAVSLTSFQLDAYNSL